MHHVIIALGSNINQEENIAKATKMLSDILHTSRWSRMVWTVPIGIISENFLNQLVDGYTELSCPDLINELKRIEKLCGRKKGIVTIDADIMLYDDQQFHLSDWDREYIKELMCEIEKG